MPESEFLQDLLTVIDDQWHEERVGERAVHAADIFQIENNQIVDPENGLDALQPILSRAGTIGQIDQMIADWRLRESREKESFE